MAEGRISISYVVNANEFNSNVSQMKKNMQLCNQEIKNSAKEINLYGNNIQNLSNKQKAIQQAIDQSNKIIKAYSDNIEKNKKALANNSDELQKLATKKKEANKAYKDAVKNYGEESEEAKKLKQALNDVSQEYVTMQSRVKGNEKAITTGTAQLEKQRGVLLDLQRQLKETNEELDKQTDGFVQASEKFASAGKKYEELGGKIGKIGGVVATAGASLMTAASGLAALGVEMDNSFAGLGGKVGATVEETEKLKEIALNLYENGFGESIDDCINDIVLLQQNIKGASDYTDEEKTKLLEYMNNIKSLFGATSEELTRTVNNMLQNGIVGSAEEAFDVITVGFQNGLNSGGDLLDVLYEYSPQFKKLGINGQNALELIKAGLDNGAYNADKMADAIKEFSIRAIDGSNTTIDAFNSMGFSAEEMMSKFGEGGDTARQAFDEVLVALKSIEDPVEQDRIAVELFGTMWEDSSKQAILAMADIGDGLGDVTGATEKAGKEINNSIGTKMERAVRKLKDNFAKLGQSLLPVLEQAAEGVDKLATFISKLNPETVTAVAKFGALALAFGTVMKATGSLVTVLGKGAQGISAILKIAGNTKALGSFSQALAESGTAAGGLFKSVGGLSKVFSGFTLTGGLIGGAIAGITALGIAFYNNQKEISDSEKKIAEMGDGIDDFTGRVRSNGSILEEVFGKKLTWNISDDYKQRLEESKGKVEEWVQYIKGLQEEIQGILNSTEKTDYQKNSEVDELLGTGQKYTGVVNAETKAGYMSYMEDKGFSKEAISSYVNAWEEAYAQDVENFNKNQDMIQSLYESDMQKYGKLTKETEDKITELKEENAVLQTNIESTKYEDLDAMSEKRILQIQKEQEEVNTARSQGLNSQLQAERQAVNEKYNLMRENVENSVWASETERQTTLDNIAKMQQAEMDRTTFNQQQNLLRAEYDRDYAYEHGLTVEDMITANNNWATIIKDSNGQIVSSYFSTADQMKNWANEMGYGYTQVETANGQLVSVVLDANGNIIGSVDNLANKYNINCESINSALSNYQGTTSEKMEQIKRDLDSGIIKAEEYGMTADEFYEVARACYESGGDIKKLIDLLYQIPTERNVTVNADVSDAIAKLNYLKQVAEDTGTKIAGVNSPGGAIPMDGYETGGTVNKSGIYTVNEAGVELIDSFGTSAASNYSLGSAVRGEYAYLEQGTKVTNALMTTQKMKNMVSSEVALAVNMAVNGMKREIIDALKISGNDNKGFNITMNDPHFENKGSENANVSNIRRIVNSMK